MNFATHGLLMMMLLLDGLLLMMLLLVVPVAALSRNATDQWKELSNGIDSF